MKRLSFFILPILCLTVCTPSWAWWRGGYGFRGGGPRVVVGVGPWWPYDYPDPYYPPYYGYGYSQAPYAPYVYASAEASSPASAALPSKEELRFRYDDGDISKEEYEAGLRRLDEPPPPPPAAAVPKPQGESLAAVNDLLLELHVLLDQKLKEGSITTAQHDAEGRYLSQLDTQARSEAQANGGRLPADVSSDLVHKLHQAYYTINHNLIVNP